MVKSAASSDAQTRETLSMDLLDVTLAQQVQAEQLPAIPTIICPALDGLFLTAMICANIMSETDSGLCVECFWKGF